MITTGIKGNLSKKVTSSESARTVKSGELEVLSTPSLSALIEETAWKSIKNNLDEDSTTVGTYIEINHLSPTPINSKIETFSELIQINNRELVFDIKVYDDFGLIATSIHKRFIVNKTKFMTKVNTKN